MKNIENAESVLKLKELYFKQISFQKSKGVGNRPQFGFNKHLIKSDGNLFTVELKTKVETDEYQLVMELIGIFDIDGGLNDTNSHFEKNAISIMFPYIRSQLTLSTSQPGIKPVILPPININELLKQSD